MYRFWTHLDMVEGRFHQLTSNANSNLKYSKAAPRSIWKRVMCAYTIWLIPNDSPIKSPSVATRTRFWKPLFGYIPPAAGRILTFVWVYSSSNRSYSYLCLGIFLQQPVVFFTQTLWLCFQCCKVFFWFR